MGDIAEGLLNGDFDELTGEYIGPGDGYPRRMSSSRKSLPKSGGKSVFRQSQHLINTFPTLRIEVLQGNGLNVYTGKATGTITIWWQKGKWVNSRGNQWKYFHDHDKAEHEMQAIIEGLIGKRVAPVKQPAATTNTTQQCIDHILSKADTVIKANGPAAVSNILKTVAQELKQYL